jgi:two-component system sensor histidine kinase BaeS
MARRGPLGLGGLWVRLALAFLAVSVLALVVATMLTEKGVGSSIAAIARQQERGLAHAAALTAGAAYEGVGWPHADLDPVLDLAEQAGAGVQIRDHAGRVVGSSHGYASYPTARERTLPIVAATHPGKAKVEVGQITVRFGGRGVGALAETFEAQRLQGRILAVAIAALIALVGSVAAARLVIVPIEVMLTAMHARATGDRDYRISNVRAPGVLRQLLEGFNQTADALDAMDRAQRNLIADVTHEVRTAAAILHATTEALADGLTEPTPVSLGSLNTEVTRLVRMVDGLQRLATAVSAEMQLQRDQHDLASIAAEAAGRLADAFASANIRLNTQLRPAIVLCDHDRMQDVISNLLTNALKFTPAGGCVTIQTEQDDNQAIARVCDTGIGIPADELPRVTQRFFRGQRSAAMASGSGIGMAIVSELVRSHHGHLAISSEEGVGTQVTVTLPATGN